jgi:hypothetical protein
VWSVERGPWQTGSASGAVEPWTNVSVGVGSRTVAYLWEWEGHRPRRLRVLRSMRGFAASADDAWQGAGGQLEIYEGEGTSLRDAGLAPLTGYCYTFFARDGSGAWRELLREHVTTLAEDAPPRGRPLLGDDGGTPGEGARDLLDVVGGLAELLMP